jgi:hypothetical protein
MPKGGSKPGERRGGRQRGTPNKTTMERLLRAERETAVAQAEGRKLAKEVLDDFMVLFAGMAAHHQPMPRGQAAPPGRQPDEAKFEKYARLAIATAADLAPYQSPTFKAIAVMAPQIPALGGGDVLSLEHAVEMSVDDPVQVSRVYRFIMTGEQRARGRRGSR